MEFKQYPVRFFRKDVWVVLAFFGFLLVSGCDSTKTAWIECKNDGFCGAELEVVSFLGEIPISPTDPFWNSPNGPKAITVELGPQMVTNPQWPNPSTQQVSVSAVRSDSEIAVKLKWEDASEDIRPEYSDQYPDQAAVMFPLELGDEIPAITMGSDNFAVNIWQWKSVWNKALTPEASNMPKTNKDGSPLNRTFLVDDLNAEGFSTLTIQEEQNVSGAGVWADNTWQVVFKRSLTNSDENDTQIKSSVPMAVAIWNGANRERNGQKGISQWLLLKFN